jgi:putative membrane protein
MKTRILLSVMFLILSAVACAPDLDTAPMGGWNHMMGYGGGILMWFLFLILVAVVVYLVIQSTRARTGDGAPKETAMEILKKRFARGEITKEEYEERKRILEG